MRQLITLAVINPSITIFLVIITVLTGLYSIKHMPVDLFPNLDIPVVNIVSHYQGASPEDIEQLVTVPIENELRTILGIKRVSSTSVGGISQITAEFSWGVTVRDARQLVQAKLANLYGILPTNVSPHLESIGTTLQEVAGYIITGGNNTTELRSIAKHSLATRVMAVDGVSSVDIIGGTQKAYIIKVNGQKLVNRKVSIEQIKQALKTNNISGVAGFLDESNREYLIHGDGVLKTVEDIRNTPLGIDGSEILLGDIATVEEGKVPRHFVVRGNRAPAVAVVVRKQVGKSTLKVVPAVDNEMRRLQSLFPKGVKIQKYYDQSEIIRESKNEILNDIFIGMILAILVLYFFLGSIRPTLIVALTIPITFLATVTIIHLLGIGFNMMTMTALTLAIGMIVDDAIVVAENIFRHRDSGKSGQELAIEGAIEIAGADTAGTSTTVIAFLPLIMLTGLAAIFMRSFGITISVALAISLLLSLTVVPALFAKIGLNSSSKRTNYLGAKVIKWIQEKHHNLLEYSLNHSKIVFVLTVLLILISSLTLVVGKVAVLPPIDEGAILVEYIMPPGTALSESNRIGDIIDSIALSNPNIKSVYRRTGSPEKGYQIEGVNRGEIVMKLKNKSIRKNSADEIISQLKSVLSNISATVFMYHQPTQEKMDESFSGLPVLFGVTIYGKDIDTLVTLAAQVEKLMNREKYVANVVNNTKIPVPQVSVKIDKPALAQYGVTSNTVMNTLVASRSHIDATNIIRAKQSIAVLIESDTKVTTVDEIANIMVPTKKGLVPLSKLTEIVTKFVPASITRLNGERDITLLAEVDGSIPQDVKKLRKVFSSLSLPEGYSIDFSGQYHIMINTAVELLFVLIAAIFLIYIVMVIQFKSKLQPLLIMVTIPLALAGALIALFITGKGVDISVAMGLLTLVGIAVNNAIVLIDYSNREMAKGVDLKSSIFNSASVRLRPILLTTLTTVAALIPAVIGTTIGSEQFQPFAITVVGGLVGVSFSTLIVVPLLLWQFGKRI